MNPDTENRILTMLTDITSRLTILEDNTQVMFNNSVLDNLDEINDPMLITRRV